MDETEFAEYFEKLKNECKKYGYIASKNLHMIRIQTKYEYWYIEIKSDEKIKLMHLKDYPFSFGTDYHKHFCRHISISDLVLYVHEHELAKYSGEVISFHFTKDGRKIEKES